MISITFGNDEVFELDTNNLPQGAAFHDLVELLDESNVSTRQQHVVAMEYYKQGLVHEFVEMLESLIKSSSFNETDQNLTVALLNAYLIKNNRTPTFQGSLEINNLLKGVVALKQHNHDDASRLFKTCRFSLGVEIVEFLANKKFGFKNGVLKFLSAYRDGRSSEASTGTEMNRYVRYRIDSEYRKQIDITDDQIDACNEGVSSDKSNFLGNPDVLLTIAEECATSDGERALKILGMIPENASTLFLRGKIEHMQKNYEAALEYYQRSGTLLATYARSRIEQNKVEELKFKTRESTNFHVYLAKKLNVGTKIECEVYDVFRAKETPSVYSYRRLINNAYVSLFSVLNNLAFYVWLEMERFKILTPDFRSLKKEEGDTGGKDDRSLHEGSSVGNVDAHEKMYDQILGTDDDVSKLRKIRSLREMCLDFVTYDARIEQQKKMLARLLEITLKHAPEKYKETVRENIKTLDNDALEQALAHNDVDKVKETQDLGLLGYLHLINKSFDTAKKILKDDDVALGFIYMEYFTKDKNEKFLEKSLGFFKKSSSVYAINGIALAFIHRGMFAEAKSILKKLVLELPFANINLGNLYILESQYAKAIACLRRVPLSKYTFRVLRLLALIEEDKKLMGDLLSFVKDHELESRLRRATKIERELGGASSSRDTKKRASQESGDAPNKASKTDDQH